VSTDVKGKTEEWETIERKKPPKKGGKKKGKKKGEK